MWNSISISGFTRATASFTALSTAFTCSGDLTTSDIHVFGCIFDAADEEDSRRAYDACRLLITEAAKAGFGEYRAHIDNMDLTQSTFSFGDHAYRRFVERIKDAVDPNGILAPGKQGIWPASYRAER